MSTDDLHAYSGDEHRTHPLDLLEPERVDPAESPLLDPGSDGAIGGKPDYVLDKLVEYREQGMSMERIRRDFCLNPAKVTNGDIERAADNWSQRQDMQAGRTVGRRRYWGGTPRPLYATKAEYEAAQARLKVQTEQRIRDDMLDLPALLEGTPTQMPRPIGGVATEGAQHE